MHLSRNDLIGVLATSAALFFVAAIVVGII
jgi:hypothetical protein